MGASGGRRRAEGAPSSNGPLLALGGMFLGALAGAAAWYFLVSAAIDFGGEARNGREVAWVFMLLATLGAITCLLLVLVLATRGLTAIGLVRDRNAAASGGRRRASDK